MFFPFITAINALVIRNRAPLVQQGFGLAVLQHTQTLRCARQCCGVLNEAYIFIKFRPLPFPTQ